MNAYSETIRQSAVSGRFYPDETTALREQVTAYLALQPPKHVDLGGAEPLAVLAPHAGYVFSGGIAGMTFGRVNAPDRVVLLGPNHTGRGAPLSVWNGGGWKTPLGVMHIDEPARAALVDSGAGFTPDAAAHEEEHSLEVIVPFLQAMNPNALFTPVVVSAVPPEALEAAGNALADVIAGAEKNGERILIVVSSDMSHFLAHDDAVIADSVALSVLRSLDAMKFFTVARGNNISMCGVFPMTLALFALARLRAANAHIVAYATSGQTGKNFGADMNRVVGYAGVVVTR